MTKGGCILFGQAPAVECIIERLSPFGATLRIEDEVAIPDTCTLKVAHAGSSYPCRVISRHGARVEVLFI